MFDIEIEASVREKWEGEVVLGLCQLTDCKPIGTKGAAELEDAMAKLATEVQRKGKAVLEEPRVQQMRATFRAMPDMDPGRYRPASESLIRRVLDSGFFRISPLVDTNNLLSVKLRVPLGIYDLARVPPQGWTYRLGHSGETYRTLSLQEKSAGGKLVLADAGGIFGSPVTDAGRAPIQAGSTNVAVVVYLPRGISVGETEELLKDIDKVFGTWFTPGEAERWVITL